MTSWLSSWETRFKGVGGVYFVSQNADSKDIKIGFSRDIPRRMSQFRHCFQGDVFVHALAFYADAPSDQEYSNIAEWKLHKFLEGGGVPGVRRLASRRRDSKRQTEYFAFPNKGVMRTAVEALALQRPLPTRILWFSRPGARGVTVYPSKRLPAPGPGGGSDPIRRTARRQTPAGQALVDRENMYMVEARAAARRIARAQGRRRTGGRLTRSMARGTFGS